VDNVKLLHAAQANEAGAEKAFLLTSEAKERAGEGLNLAINELAEANRRHKQASDVYRVAGDTLESVRLSVIVARVVTLIVQHEPHLIPDFLAESPSEKALASQANARLLLVIPLRQAEWSSLGHRVRNALVELLKLSQEAE
jgi:hypothetical protein